MISLSSILIVHIVFIVLFCLSVASIQLNIEDQVNFNLIPSHFGIEIDRRAPTSDNSVLLLLFMGGMSPSVASGTSMEKTKGSSLRRIIFFFRFVLVKGQSLTENHLSVFLTETFRIHYSG